MRLEDNCAEKSEEDHSLAELREGVVLVRSVGRDRHVCAARGRQPSWVYD